MPGKFIPFIVVVILIFAGCAPEIQKPIEVVPGKESVAEALSVLKARSQNAVPLRARGRCLLQYYDAGKKKRKKESLTVLVLVKPPVEIYLQGDATLVPKAIILGSNEREFWMLMRPKEISTYWLGTWSEKDSSEGLLINPKTLFEALGILEIEAEENWSLSNEGAFDVLTRRERGVVIKKIYIYRRDYLAKKILYFDSTGQAVAYTELGDYKEVSEGFFVPASIKIITFGQNNSEDSLSINLDLKSIKPAKFNERQQKIYFNPPSQGGFKHILISEGGKWIEQRR
ncbi:MAG: hypothetical protein IIB56_14360 [Planctomycetes bacterium]|nr:hypothetical protein [Planctomycetota bacterium]